MARLSIGQAWEEAVPFVRREASLLLPVALLFLALPAVILSQMTPPDLLESLRKPLTQRPDLPWSFIAALPIVLILTQAGAMALLALALTPGISVAEALHLAARRVPVLLAVVALTGLALLLLTVLVSMIGGIAALVIGQAAAVMLTTLIALPLIVYVLVRLILINAVIVDCRQGPVSTIRRAWTLSAGHVWRLFGFIAITTIVGQIIGGAFASIFGIVGGLIGGPDIAGLLSALAGAIVVAAVQTYMLAMMARLYTQLR